MDSLDIAEGCGQTPSAKHLLRWNSDKLISAHLVVQPETLRQAIENVCSSAVVQAIARGRVPNYVEINAAILSISNLSQVERDRGLTQGLTGPGLAILQQLIEAGGQLDQYQYTLLQKVAGDSATTIEQLLTQPHWSRVCSIERESNAGLDPVRGGGDVTPELQKLAYMLNLDPFARRTEICSSLTRLHQADPTELKAAAIKRQMLRVSSSVAAPDEYISNISARASLLCRNRALLDANPYEYNDLDLSFYKDEGGVLFCFTSDMFEHLLKTKRNPYTEQPLPLDYLKSIKSQRNALKRLGYDVGSYTEDSDLGKPATFSAGLDRLQQPNQISNDQSEDITSSLIRAAACHGLPEEVIMEISLDTMESALQAVEIWEPQLARLPIANARVTFYRIAAQLLHQKPDCMPVLFGSLCVLI